jgi:hypothetical protein
MIPISIWLTHDTIVAALCCIGAKTLSTSPSIIGNTTQQSSIAILSACLLTLGICPAEAAAWQCLSVWVCGFFVVLVAFRRLSSAMADRLRGLVESSAPTCLLFGAFGHLAPHPIHPGHFIAGALFLAFSIGMSMTLIRKHEGTRRMIGIYSILPALMLFTFSLRRLLSFLLTPA